jgi:hypothetical protein
MAVVVCMSVLREESRRVGLKADPWRIQENPAPGLLTTFCQESYT